MISAKKNGTGEGENQECWGCRVAVLNGVVKVGLLEKAVYVLVGGMEHSDMSQGEW